jgi:hypothetical protein
MNELNRDVIIEAARRAAAESTEPMSRADFERVTGISQYHIYRNFPDGGWSEVKDLAGLARHPKDNQPLTDEELLLAFHEVANELGEVPTWSVFNATADISADVIRRRFGGLQGTLRKYSEWLGANDPDSPLLAKLNLRSKHELPVPPKADDKNRGDEPAHVFSWEQIDGPQFGPPIDFRGLRHAPINEQGVVFLFGMVAFELGFIVEAVHAAYPDCEAKRRIDDKGGRWQRVRIEFEFRSRSFLAHGHDPLKCDLIVCWEHDWVDCPIEVIELRRVIDELDG